MLITREGSDKPRHHEASGTRTGHGIPCLWVYVHHILERAQRIGVFVGSVPHAHAIRHIHSTACYIFLVDRPDVLREALSETGTTQSQLSRLSGVKQPSLSQMLSGRIEMSDEMLGRLLSCVGYRLEVVRRPVRVQLDRSSRRRWRMHQRLVSQLSPEILKQWTPAIRRNLRQLRRDTRGEPHMSNLDRWQRLVSSGDVRGLRLVMTGLDTDSIQMREVSPLGGLLSEGDRQHVLEEMLR